MGHVPCHYVINCQRVTPIVCSMRGVPLKYQIISGISPKHVDKLWFIDLANPGLILAHPLVDHVPDEKLSFHIYIPF